MTIDLPAPVASFFKAQNAHDFDGVAALFGENASVKDEDEEYRGRPAIRAWIEEAMNKYHVTVEVKGARNAGDNVVVSGLVSGNFPGSPIVLDHTFTLSGQSIDRLVIE